MFKSIEIFLNFILENWTFITTLLACIYLGYVKIKKWNALSEKEKVDIALNILREQMLAYITEAEKTYGSGTGTIKRSEVIKKVYKDYPILNKVVNQEELIKKLDEYINDSLKELRKLLENNEEFKNLIMKDK
jgi:PII-like signaling protein